MSENINEIIKLPVIFDDEKTYAHKWIFDAKGETVARIVNGEQSEKKAIGEFIAQAINSFEANQRRIAELQAENKTLRDACAYTCDCLPDEAYALHLKVAELEKPCKWSSDEAAYYHNHSTACGKEFEFSSGDVKENNFKFCPFCGGRIEAEY